MTRDELRSVLPGGKHHDVAMKWVADDAAVLQSRNNGLGQWVEARGFDSCLTTLFNTNEYRIKPQTLRYRVALMQAKGLPAYLQFCLTDDGATHLEQMVSFVHWLGDWQEVEA